MKGASCLLLLWVVTMTNDKSLDASQASASPAHVSNRFRFTVGAPLSRAATLFGPEGERCWAGEHWNPEFLYPQPGKDVQGAVFRIQQGPHKSVWVNTLFDLAAGRMQYVSFIPEALVSTVDVRLTALDPSSTSVEVTYARTALDAAANDDVEAIGKSDLASGPHWQKAIEMCLAEKR
jgi:hypothetical protein